MSRGEPCYVPTRKIEALEPGQRPQEDTIVFDLNDCSFSTRGLETFAGKNWQAVIYDTVVVTAAIEFADRMVKRPESGWRRRLIVRIPVHEPGQWEAPSVYGALVNCISFLTGDDWEFEFVQRQFAARPPEQGVLELPMRSAAVLAYSDGLDSRAMAGIFGKTRRGRLVRVRVGLNVADIDKDRRHRDAFTRVPYELRLKSKSRESSARSRGFKFAIISAIASHLTETHEIIIPESGQGALGPALVLVGHGYPDFRNHPQFTQRMERFVYALFGTPITYTFPRMAFTKAQTLREFIDLTDDTQISTAKSCWRKNHWVSVDGGWRHCGVCAACMLRRMSMHAAGIHESRDAYICEDMSAPSLVDAVAPGYDKVEGAYTRYAIAGVLHLDHLAEMAFSDRQSEVRRHAGLVSAALGETLEKSYGGMKTMLSMHATEWRNFVNELGTRSYVRHWARVVQ